MYKRQTDDLVGWEEYKDGVKHRETGILSSFELGEDYANELIMKARKIIGIVEEEIEEEIEEELDEDKDTDHEIVVEDDSSEIKSDDN